MQVRRDWSCTRSLRASNRSAAWADPVHPVPRHDLYACKLRIGGSLSTVAVAMRLADVAPVATATYTSEQSRRKTRNPRLGACAHAFGYRGHCMSKSRRYSTTFKALRLAREQHVQERLAASDDASQRALGDVEPASRIATFTYAGRGHLTTADAFLAASAAARAREQRAAARLERLMAIETGGRS